MKKIIFQLFTGDLTEKSLADPQSIIDKLEMAQKAGKLAGVLCGWTTDRDFYKMLGDKLQRWGVPLYLKIAVFSELTGYTQYDPMIDYNGEIMKPYMLNPQESFEFRCPSSKRNRSVLLDLYHEKFDGLPFDGIFLDRIRYSSFLSGVAGVGGCFCDECVKRYEKAGICVDDLRQRLAKLAADKDLQLTSYHKGCWKLEDPLLDAFFRVKTQIISEALEEYAKAFHVMGFKIGFDLFTPALGYFCGQDAQRLRQVADFIKPMMYRYTDAPAGLPFERERLIQAVGLKAGEQFDRLAGSAEEDHLDLVQKELRWMQAEPGCDVWPGIEANYIEPIARITPAMIRNNLDTLKTLGVEQMVASWNLNKIPMENMKELLAD